MNETFTAGKWKAIAYPTGGGPEEWKVEPDADGSPNDDYQICACFGPERRLNAHLIAAAPCMYEALKAVQPLLPAVWAYNKQAQPILQQIAAALAKANGETS